VLIFIGHKKLQTKMNYTYSFEKLSVWQMNRVFTKKLYRQTAAFPKEELFGITAQIRRASISISCNLAEGSARISSKEQFRFYEIAFGSGVEVVNLLILSNDLGYLSDDDYHLLRSEIEKITYQINKLAQQRR
jgi:four helix bundle protein